MTPLDRVRIEKAAADCGFEITPLEVAGGLTLRSARFPETVSVAQEDGGAFRITASNPLLLVNEDAGAAVRIAGYSDLYAALKMASARARTLPDRVADQFKKAVSGMPSATEAERQIIQRIGQDLFRTALLDYWHGRCCITGLSVPALLRASHIKPWAKCASDEERLDVFNGLLLAPHVDALFDGGWISFADDGTVIVSGALPADDAQRIGFSPAWRLHGLQPCHRAYLLFHRERELRHVPQDTTPLPSRN